MPGLSRDEFLEHIGLVREDVQGVHVRLDALNGRTRSAENTIAVLKWAVGLIGVASLAIFGVLLSKVWP